MFCATPHCNTSPRAAGHGRRNSLSSSSKAALARVPAHCGGGHDAHCATQFRQLTPLLVRKNGKQPAVHIFILIRCMTNKNKQQNSAHAGRLRSSLITRRFYLWIYCVHVVWYTRTQLSYHFHTHDVCALRLRANAARQATYNCCLAMVHGSMFAFFTCTLTSVAGLAWFICVCLSAYDLCWLVDEPPFSVLTPYSLYRLCSVHTVLFASSSCNMPLHMDSVLNNLSPCALYYLSSAIPPGTACLLLTSRTFGRYGYMLCTTFLDCLTSRWFHCATLFWHSGLSLSLYWTLRSAFACHPSPSYAPPWVPHCLSCLPLLVHLFPPPPIPVPLSSHLGAWIPPFLCYTYASSRRHYLLLPTLPFGFAVPSVHAPSTVSHLLYLNILLSLPHAATGLLFSVYAGHHRLSAVTLTIKCCGLLPLQQFHCLPMDS